VLQHRAYNRHVTQDEDINPLTTLVTFPEAIVVTEQEGRPSESHGWLLYFLLEMRKPIVAAHLRAQLETAGYVAEGASATTGLSRFIKDDSLVWATIADAPDARTSLLLSIAGPPPEGESTDESHEPDEMGG
jgi:hypothetical protein